MRWFRFRQASRSRWSRAADAHRTSRSHGPKCCRLSGRSATVVLPREGWMRRRDFIAGLGCAAAWPLVARAQQTGTGPLVGFLNSASPDTYRFNADSFQEGLARAGFVDGRNVRIEERWARGDYDALPDLAA